MSVESTLAHFQFLRSWAIDRLETMDQEQTWLLTGGAGYIGSHIADEFISAGKSVLIYDSLYQGLRSRIEYLENKHHVDIPFIEADILDYKRLDKTIKKYNIHGIVHTAALKAVGESMSNPDQYFKVNLNATIELLNLAEVNGVRNFIFSSTAAVYGSPDSTELCKENSPVAPISPYGDSKYQAEAYVEKFVSKPGNHGTSLRFFNVIGSGGSPELLDNSVENLIPIVINRMKAGESPIIFGTDYPTFDGTCIRDYVDVRDVAKAHLAVADSTNILPTTINIGTGRGVSVRQIINQVLLGLDKVNTPIIETYRRTGDPVFLCADVNLAKTILKFEARYSLEESIESIL
jgi:UDP-glucose 4-epimerase